MTIEVTSEQDMKRLAKTISRALKGGEIIELVGDIGAGKTTFVKGLAVGLGVDDDVQSPTFTISRVYKASNDLTLAHYDFYRLNDPGILADELSETIHDPKTVTAIEWAGVVEGVLPAERITISFEATSETSRRLNLLGLPEASLAGWNKSAAERGLDK